MKLILKSLLLLLLICSLKLSAAELVEAAEVANHIAAADSNAAAKEAEQATGGRVVDVKEDLVDGKVVYQVKVLLDDGRVKVVTISGD